MALQAFSVSGRRSIPLDSLSGEALRMAWYYRATMLSGVTFYMAMRFLEADDLGAAFYVFGESFYGMGAAKDYISAA